MLNSWIFQKVFKANKQILLVTKYWDTETTTEIFSLAQKEFWCVIFGLWENRIEQIREKNIPRKNMHFIGNIQSQKIPDIVKYCSCIHSLSSLKHAQKIEKQNLTVQAFIQIQLDPNKNIWIWEEEKREEFRKLVSLRKTYIPKWSISAWTSRDYDIALEEGIDVVRVGSKILKY